MCILAWIGALWLAFTTFRVARFIWLALRENRDGGSGRHKPLKEWRRHVGQPPTTGI